MFAWLRRPPVTLPSDADLVFTADDVYVWRRTAILVGRVECDELRVGDEVVAVGDGPVGRWQVAGLEQFNRALSAAVRGEKVGVVLGPRAPAALPAGVRLFRVQG